MKLSELTKDIPCRIDGAIDTEVSGLQYDSRKVRPGDMFFCIRGFAADGRKFAPAAVEKGAVCIVTPSRLEVDVPQIVVEDEREAMAAISAAFYGYPARELRMVGVTGTNGKTSTTYMLKHIFEAAGSKVGLMGTIVNMIGQEALHTDRTTPESMDFQRLLREMADRGVDTVVMEVSSHSLVLKRVFGVEFAGSIFTNLTQDHLDFHGTFEKYAAAKAMLFANSRISAVNLDDAYGAYMLDAAAGRSVSFGLEGERDYLAEDVALDRTGSAYTLRRRGGVLEKYHMGIPGAFSVYNSLGAIALAGELGIETDAIRRGIASVACVPGRFQSLDTRGGEYSVILDYSHTPDSLESALKTIRGFSRGRVVCVFGCGGNRDNTKRPIMGKIAAELADVTIVTSDNPRFEEPMAIIDEILPGVQAAGGAHIVIENRRDAIRYALEHAQAEDVILLAGKGHEDYQEIRGVKHDFDEKKVVAELLDELGR